MALEATSPRIVHCKKLAKDLAGLEKPPFGGELGKQIFDHISAAAWKSWNDDMQIKVVNEYRLNMGQKKDYEFLIEQMKAFLNLQPEGSHLSVVEVENAERGRQTK